MKEDGAVPPEKTSILLFQLSDAEGVLMCMQADQVAQFCRWDTLKSREDAENYLKEVIFRHARFRAMSMENRAVGFIWVKMGTNEIPLQRRNRVPFDYWGRGLATLAVKVVFSFIFKEFPEIERLEGLVVADNRGSQRVLQKAGLLNKGLLRKYWYFKGNRDAVIYSFLSTESRSRADLV